MLNVVSFVGKSGSGKTTLLEQVIRELKNRGYRVGVIKHTHHDFDIDKPGKDTWRFAQAGGDMIAISSPGKMSLIERVDSEIPLDQIIALFKDKVDIVLIEGYKHSGEAKIEVSRSEQGQDLLFAEDELLAIVSDRRFPMKVPQFDLNDTGGVVNLLITLMSEKTSLE